MTALLPGLIHDLRRRCVHLRGRLIGLPDDEAFNDLALSAFIAVADVVRELDQIVADPTLGDPSFAADHLRQFRRLAEQVILTESYAVPSLERFHADDRQLTRIAARLINESCLPLPPPVVVASSTQYYWTLPYFTLVSVPAGEAASILGLPDLGHELGHLLIVLQPVELLSGAEAVVATYFTSALSGALASGAPHAAELALAARQWGDEWLTELACDAVGCYLFGSAFALQHVRLCALFGNPLWTPALGDTAVHPADDARLRVVVAVLRAMGDDAGATAAEDSWAELSSAAPEPKPAGYDLCYPATLLSSVGGELHAALVRMGVNACPGGSGTLAELVVEAWQRFRADGSTYGAWEDTALASL